MAKILICPNKYVQGAGEMAKIADYAKAYGKKALVVITASGYKRIGSILEASFANGEVAAVYDYFNGECSWNEINRLIEIMKANECDMVIGIGGGKILDTSKAVAHACKTPVIICPTIASTDAPCSALSVVYTDEGVFEEYHWLPANPNMVLMDTSIIAKSPARLTVSGIGDALATYYEARATKAKDAGTCAGGKVTCAAMALAELCLDTLLEEGVKAKLALESGACTESVEKVIEANTLLSGIGDALATYYEARATKAKDAGTCAGGKVTCAAMALAEQYAVQKSGIGIIPASDDLRAGMIQVSFKLESHFAEIIYRQIENMMNYIYFDIGFKYDWRFRMFGNLSEDEKMLKEAKDGMTLGILSSTLDYLALNGRRLSDDLSASCMVIGSGVMDMRLPLVSTYSAKQSESGLPPRRREKTQDGGGRTGRARLVDKGGRPKTEEIITEGREQDFDQGK